MYLDCIFASNAGILLNIEKQHDIVVWDSCRLQAYMKRPLLLWKYKPNNIGVWYFTLKITATVWPPLLLVKYKSFVKLSVSCWTFLHPYVEIYCKIGFLRIPAGLIFTFFQHFTCVDDSASLIVGNFHSYCSANTERMLGNNKNTHNHKGNAAFCRNKQ